MERKVERQRERCGRKRGEEWEGVNGVCRKVVVVMVGKGYVCRITSNEALHKINRHAGGNVGGVGTRRAKVNGR